jgi:phosphoadenosine phosphosulfate reductase
MENKVAAPEDLKLSYKVEIAIERIRSFYTEPYYFGLSGGKDSDVVDKLLQMSGVKYERHHQHTTVDAPQTIKYIRQTYPDTIIDYPKRSMWQLIVHKGIPPTRLIRYCCKELKEYGGQGRLKILGIRWAESTRRKNNRRMVEICNKDITRTINPIIDWTDEDVWEFIKKYNLPYNPLYDLGQKRIGCVMCPQKGRKGMQEDAKMFPVYYNNYLKAFERMLENRKSKGLNTTWKTSADVMEWWLNISK